jgi:gamma-glutamyltranspeptidase/glutathione hydrolase
MNCLVLIWIAGTSAIVATPTGGLGDASSNLSRPQSLSADVCTAQHGMVVSNHRLATEAGVNVLKNGGNAVDAAVAVALTLGIVDSSNSGIGGGCFFLAQLADGRLVALDGRETAPARASASMFVRNGKGDTELSQVGALASGVPGSLAVYGYATSKYGKKSLSSLLLPAAKIAEQGFSIDHSFIVKLRENSKTLARFPSTKAVLFKDDGSPLSAGDILKQRDLGQTYRAIAAQGIDWFYKGPFAQATEAWMRSNGGILTAADFANYQVKTRTPLQTKYRGYTVVGFPPPSSGGIHVAQMLAMLDQFDLSALEKKDAASRVHVTAEAMKLAFADRAHWLGDPDFVKVPKGLIDPTYCIERAKTIDPGHARHDVQHGDPPTAGFGAPLPSKAPSAADSFNKHTTHIAVADESGNWVAITASINTVFGSKVILPGTGVLLNNQMDDFSIQPGVPNHFNLVGGDANAPAAGKRPLSSMSPTIIMKGNEPVMTLGAAGGPTIITQVVLVATNVFALHDDLRTAMSRFRFHQQWSPDRLVIENTAPDGVIEKLKTFGQFIESKSPVGATQAIVRLPDGRFAGASDPRGNGKAAGW